MASVILFTKDDLVAFHQADASQRLDRHAEFFRDNAKKAGIEVLGFEGTEEKSNFDPILTPIQAANPELIYFGGMFDQAGVMFKQARDKGQVAKSQDANQAMEVALGAPISPVPAPAGSCSAPSRSPG